MWIDVCISGALATNTILMGYLGVHVTLHPAESPAKRRWYKIGFGACAMISVALVIWQGIRNSSSQVRFEQQLARAQSNLQNLEQQFAHTHFVVEVDSAAVSDPNLFGKPLTFNRIYAPGKKTMINVNYTNTGPTESKNAGAKGLVIVSSARIEDDAIFSSLEKEFPAVWRGEELLTGAKKFITAESNPLTVDEVKGIKKGTTHLIVVAIVRFSDSTGDYQQEFCSWEEPGKIFGPWHNCPVHNSEKKIK